jgi:hypothetical protein
MINKSKVENFIIMRPNTTPAVPVAGTLLYNFTTDTINLPVGGFGVFTGVANSGNPISLDPALVTTATQDFIQFIQHRDKSGDPTPLYESTLEQSPEIKADCFLRAAGRGATTKQNSSWIIGAVATDLVNRVPVNDETEYVAGAGMRGWRVDLYNGNNTPFKQGRFTTPDYFSSTLYTVDVQRRDHLLQNLAFDFNNQSTQEVVGICLDSAAVAAPGTGNVVSLAAANVITLTAAAALTPGDVIIIGFTDDGQPIKLTVDADLIQTFADMVATGGLAGTSQIIPYARPTAANTAAVSRIVAGGEAAGVPDANVDQIIFLALDAKRAAFDETSQTKSRVQVGLESGFGTAASRSLTDSSEGSGYQRDVLQYYRNTAGHRKYIGNKPWQQLHVEFPTELVAGAIYDIFIIDSCANRTASGGLNSTSPQRTIIAVANFETAGFALFTGVANPQKAYVQTAINNWMNSTVYPHTTIAI